MQTSPIANPVTNRNIDDLEEEIISLAKHMNQDEYRFLVMVREFDIRQGWRAYQFNNCAEWLNMKCGISPGTAREKVRVALALLDLPQCSEGFARGELSYSKVRAMTRAANVFNEATLVDYALKATAHQVEEHCRRLRNADRRQSTPDARRAWQARSLKRTCHPDGMMSIYVELPREQGELVMKALEMAMAADAGDTADRAEQLYATAGQGDKANVKAGDAAGHTGNTADLANKAGQAHVAEKAAVDKTGQSKKASLADVARKAGVKAGDAVSQTGNTADLANKASLAHAANVKDGLAHAVDQAATIAGEKDGVAPAAGKVAANTKDNAGKRETAAQAQAENQQSNAFFARQADALVAVARGYLSGTGGEKQAKSDNYQVVVHVDAAALQDKGGKSDLPVESVRRIACDADLVAVTRDAKGNLLNLGRKHRVVSPQLKRALLARDKCCTYPSCSHEQFLEAHHVMHWADGGETSLDNAMLICNRHHRLLHEGGFTIHKNFAGEWYFRTAEGKVLPEAPVYKPVEYDSSRDEILEDTKVKVPQSLPVAPVHKSEDYDASRDAPEVKVPQSLPVAPVHKSEDYDASRDAPEVKVPQSLPVAPVHKSEDYDASRDAPEVKVPQSLPVAPVHKSEDYDASRDAPEVKVPQSLPVAPVHKSEDYDASRDAPEVKEPWVQYAVG